MADTTVAYTVSFTGTVQRVGFRMTTTELAKEFPELKGWVRNEANGTVTMHVQGSQTQIDQLMKRINQESRLATLIDHFTQDSTTPDAGLRDFHIER